MTLDEAIAHCLEVAENCEEQAKQCDSGDRYERHVMHENAKCATKYRQLAEWLTELKDLRDENKVLMRECDRLIKEKGALLKQHEQIAEYKQLLKAAVEDLEKIASVDECSFPYCDNRCPFECVGQCEEKHWKHQAEALALIGEDGDTNG